MKKTTESTYSMKIHKIHDKTPKLFETFITLQIS